MSEPRIMAYPQFLLQMAGTSGAGKSALAGQIGRSTGAVVLDYDIVKSAALDAGVAWDDAGRVGYGASRALAAAVLGQGHSVILDSPARFRQIVDEGAASARACGVAYGFIECVLPNEAELRRRIAERPRQRSQRPAFDRPPPDAPGDVMADADGRIWVPASALPPGEWLRIDTSQPLGECLARALAYLQALEPA